MKLSSIPSALSYFWHAKKIWGKPGKAKVLIYDRAGSELLLTYLDPKNVKILDRRGESLNLYVLFKCFLNWKLSWTNYILQYLTWVKPSVALTFVDNDPLFYLLKSHQKDLRTVFVQNGLRYKKLNMFGGSKTLINVSNEFKVDYMLVFGDSMGREYAKYIAGNTLPIGSFKNNTYQTKTEKLQKSVVFISQYRPAPRPESRPMIIDNQRVTWKQFYSAEEFLLPLLQKYCLQNQLELKICMMSSDETKHERDYFRSLLGNETFELLKKLNPYSSYEYVAAAGVVVFVSSTLGFEALARGKKTAAFALRGKALKLVARKFGWPADLSDNGPFWTNDTDEREVERVMDYITTVNDEEWERTWQRYAPELMEYDPGNTRFLKLMHEIGVPLKREYMKYV